MSDKTKRKQPPQTFRQKYRLLIVISLFLFLVAFVAIFQSILLDIIFPPPLSSHMKIRFLVSLSAPFIFVYLSALILITPARIKIVYISVFFMIIVCHFFVCSAFLFSMFMYEYPVRHRTMLKDKVYYVVTLYEYDHVGYAPYGIYECDSMEIRCTLVERGENDIYWSYDYVSISSDDVQIIIERRNYNSIMNTYVFRPATD